VGHFNKGKLDGRVNVDQLGSKDSQIQPIKLSFFFFLEKIEKIIF